MPSMPGARPGTSAVESPSILPLSAEGRELNSLRAKDLWNPACLYFHLESRSLGRLSLDVVLLWNMVAASSVLEAFRVSVWLGSGYFESL